MSCLARPRGVDQVAAMNQRRAIEAVIEQLGGLSSAARKLGLGSTTVQNWAARGQIPAVHYLALKRTLAAADLPPPDPEIFTFFDPATMPDKGRKQGQAAD